MKQRIWVCKSSRVNKYHQRAPAKRKKERKRKGTRRNVGNFEVFKGGLLQRMAPEDLRTRGFKIWGLRLQNLTVEASKLEAWGFKYGGLRLEFSKLEAWSFKIWALRLEASKFEAWGFKIFRIEAWGFKIWRLRLGASKFSGLRLQILTVEASKFDGWGFKLRGLRLEASKHDVWPNNSTPPIYQLELVASIRLDTLQFLTIVTSATSDVLNQRSEWSCHRNTGPLSSLECFDIYTLTLGGFRLGLVRAWHARPWLMIWSRTDDMILDFGSKKYQKAFTAWNL